MTVTARLLRVPLLLTAAMAVALLAAPGRAELVLHAYVLALAAFVLGRLVAWLRASLPRRAVSPVDAALRAKPPYRGRVPELERLEREVTLGLSTAFDLHFRLRPTLHRIASELLRSRRGVDLDRNPEAARNALGDETWDLVRPDRQPPPERFAPGVELESLRRVVASLEAL